MISSAFRSFSSIREASEEAEGAVVTVESEDIELADLVRYCGRGEWRFLTCTIECHGWPQERVNAFFTPETVQ